MSAVEPAAETARPAGERPAVSVVVAAYDEREHIVRCLESLRRQAYRPLEILVVDDGSRDETAALAAAVAGVRVLRQRHLGAGAARNLGAREATGEILVFVDADMAFPPGFIDRLLAPMIERGAVGTFTREIIVANGTRRWARAHQLGRGLPEDCHFPPGFPDRWGNFRAVWRDRFLRAGGFDEVGHGEDMTLAPKLGALADVAPGARCYHYEPDTLRDIFRTARWIGRGERIKELEHPLQYYGPLRSLLRATRLAVRHRLPSLFVYRLVFDAGVVLGWLTRTLDRAAGK